MLGGKEKMSSSKTDGFGYNGDVCMIGRPEKAGIKS